MEHEFIRMFRVRAYECDSLGHVNNAVYQHYLEQTTIDASTAAGYPRDWYVDRSTAWTVRQVSIEYLHPAYPDDVLAIRTWISEWGTERAHSEYTIVRQATGEQIARAGADWVYTNRKTGLPEQVPPELIDALGTNPRIVLAPYRLPEQGLESGVFRWGHQIKRYELDTTGLVNPAIYLNWIEEAKFRACDDAGWPVERMRDANFLTVQIRHDMQYHEAVTYGDEIEVLSRIYDLRRVRGTWLHEIRRVPGGELLARNYSTGAFLNLDGRPAKAPQSMLDDLLQGSFGFKIES